jgi:dTDP-4-dehydrorhamnose reductase
MRVLITGATGLLGSSLSLALEQQGVTVVRHGRRTGDVRADLTQRQAVEQLLNGVAPDAIVNLAALTNVDQCESQPSEAYRSNTLTIVNLASVIRRLRVAPYLIQISTDQVYDGPGPHAEDSVTIRNYYAMSKYAGELAASGVPSTILRTNFFGPSVRPDRTSFSDWIVGALRRREVVRVFEDVFFTPLSLQRLAALICLALERRVPGTFNLGSREGMSKAEFCFTLAEVLGLPATSLVRTDSSTAGLRATRPKDMRMDCSSFSRFFGVELPTLRLEIESMKGFYHVGS